MRPGDIYRHACWYEESGSAYAKFFLILAAPASGYLVIRLLTSKPRPERPRCHHGRPYASFFLGILGGQLPLKSWLDLRSEDDLDGDALARWVRNGDATFVATLPDALFEAALECAAGADDTTHAQEREIRNTLAGLR